MLWPFKHPAKLELCSWKITFILTLASDVCSGLHALDAKSHMGIRMVALGSHLATTVFQDFIIMALGPKLLISRLSDVLSYVRAQKNNLSR